MVRDPVLVWATVGLLALLAFILLPTYERFKDASGRDVDVAPGAPPLPKELIPIDERTGEPVNAPSVTGYDYLSWLKRERFDSPADPDSTKPSGVKVLPSQSMPNNKMLGTANESVGLDKKQQGVTIPPPKFEAGPQGIQGEDKYVLKSSLVPCSCASGQGMSCEQHAGSYPSSMVPGDQDTGGMTEDDQIKKPFSVAFDTGGEAPVGYLNSFSAFMK